MPDFQIPDQPFGMAKLLEIMTQAVEAKEYKPGVDANGVYYIKNPKTGGVEQHQVDPPPRAHVVDDIPSFAHAFSMDSQDSPVAIFYNRNSVVGLFDHRDRRNRVHMPVDLSPQIEILHDIEQTDQGRTFTQRELIRWIKVDMAGSFADATRLIGLIANVRFQAGSVNESSITKGKVSIGKSVQAELVGANALPDYITLSVPTFANTNLPWRCNVELSLDVDEHANTFILSALPLNIENAIKGAEVMLGMAIAGSLPVQSDDDINRFTVLYGSPEA